MMYRYDNNNIFAKIIQGIIHVKKVYEDDTVLAIEDNTPAAPIHILIMPKKSYISFDDFIAHATIDDINHYFKTIKIIAENVGAESYRLVTNNGLKAGQSIFHFHTHILSGVGENLIDKNL